MKGRAGVGRRGRGARGGTRLPSRSRNPSESALHGVGVSRFVSAMSAENWICIFYVCASNICSSAYVFVYVYVFVCMCLFVCIYLYAFVCISAYVFVYVYEFL